MGEAEVVRAIEDMSDEILGAVMSALCERSLERVRAAASSEQQERDPSFIGNRFVSFADMEAATSLAGAA